MKIKQLYEKYEKYEKTKKKAEEESKELISMLNKIIVPTHYGSIFTNKCYRGIPERATIKLKEIKIENNNFYLYTGLECIEVHTEEDEENYRSYIFPRYFITIKTQKEIIAENKRLKTEQLENHKKEQKKRETEYKKKKETGEKREFARLKKKFEPKKTN